jgi:SAM-dependent methyltransferase
MKAGFVESVTDTLLADGTLGRGDSVLAVCAGLRERDLLAERGFTRVVISNLEAEADMSPFEWSREDAQALSFEDGSFEFALVVAGLHHCSSPHRALVEMYRVARKGILVVEARDGLLTRAAVRLGLAEEYELSAVEAHDGNAGGADDSPVPNHVYRWTEDELRKTIRSADPTGEPSFRFFYALDVPRFYPAELPLRAVAHFFPRLGNTMAMVALRPRELFPWLAVEGGRTVFRPSRP